MYYFRRLFPVMCLYITSGYSLLLSNNLWCLSSSINYIVKYVSYNWITWISVNEFLSLKVPSIFMSFNNLKGNLIPISHDIIVKQLGFHYDKFTIIDNRDKYVRNYIQYFHFLKVDTGLSLIKFYNFRSHLCKCLMTQPNVLRLIRTPSSERVEESTIFYWKKKRPTFSLLREKTQMYLYYKPKIETYKDPRWTIIGVLSFKTRLPVRKVITC